ncbi:Patatin-like phospholipase N-terminal domain protein (plasmid) [Candidatus Trichorickettsia mobilis]|uniref:Patatin-like phospholipase N-terminal domain protein n=1 Tax=Candidatus Trichorickettsia mobilis TaxID=1346319 RepID=A0ABZ0UU06_9RICK|nr:patatin-like phospholipase family protein [Candidatus Trichorickettsia mobilis]WPY01517.1 Patatin-like phospholipase N-terminal domain protein [Candidatus Trichorickettsia mobilis]
MDKDTIRVFSFSGGSTKGYGENRFMQKFLHQWGIPQADFWKYPDVMCGTSIGAILACAYAYGKTPDQMESFFLEEAKKIFSISTTDSDRPSTLSKILSIANNNAFYTSPDSSSNFGHNVLHQTLERNFGTSTLANLNVPIVIPAVEQDMSRPVYFSNFNDPAYFIGRDFKIVDVCRASSAAFPYLPSHPFNGHDYIDGTFLINNAVDRAIKLGLTIKPNVKRIVVVNVGAGIGRNGFDGSDPLGETSAERIFAYTTLLMTNAEQNSHKNLQYEADRLNNGYGLPLFYYGWYPTFPEDFNNEVDNSTPEWYAELANIIDAHYANESDKISSILTHLTA